jgi:hypothetical protein
MPHWQQVGAIQLEKNKEWGICKESKSPSKAQTKRTIVVLGPQKRT